MPKTNWTDEERAAFADKMKAARAAKKNEVTEVVEAPVAAPEEHPQPQGTTIGGEDLSTLLSLVKSLLENGGMQALPQGPQIRGTRIVGTTDKYIVDPSHYPDPRARLSAEKALQRFAFGDNYELEWEITSTQYETKDGLNFREPKFRLALIRKVYDEETGELTNGRYTVCQLVFHEDPQAALVVARENGLEVPAEMEDNFLNEMRYLRMRDWLVEAFMPPKSAQPKKNKKEVVIGGKVVQYFEINSEDSEIIPFNQLKKY